MFSLFVGGSETSTDSIAPDVTLSMAADWSVEFVTSVVDVGGGRVGLLGGSSSEDDFGLTVKNRPFRS